MTSWVTRGGGGGGGRERERERERERARESATTKKLRRNIMLLALLTACDGKE